MNHEVNCKHCGRYLFTAQSTTIIEQMPCANSKCKAKLNIKVVDSQSTLKDIQHRFETAEVPPKSAKTEEPAMQQ